MKKVTLFLNKATYLVMLLIASLTMFTGCSDDDKTSSAENFPPSDEETHFNSAITGVQYKGNTVMLGLGEKAEMTKACELLFPNRQATVSESTDLLIIPAGNKYQKEAEQVMEQGGIVATYQPSDDILLSATDGQGYSYKVYEPNLDEVFVDNSQEAAETQSYTNLFDDVEWNQPELQEEDQNNDGSGDEMADMDAVDPELGDNDIYTYLNGWVADMNKYEEKKVENSNGDDDLSKDFTQYHYGVTYTYDDIKKEVRHLKKSKRDYIEGSGAINASFDIYQVHCYEGQAGSGDYYIVNMSSSVSNKDMYKGKWWNRHGGSYVRICGFYGKAFAMECIPLKCEKKDGKKVYTELNTDDIYFTASGTPSPQTTINQVTYTSSHTHGVEAGLSVAAGAKGDIPYAEAKYTMKAGWSWTHSKTYTINDMDIKNTQRKNIAAYELVFKNLPYFRWKSSRGFEEGNSNIYRATAEVNAAWAWYMPKMKDNSDESPIAIRFIARPTYGAMSFVSTKADLHTFTYTDIGNVNYVIDLQPFTRDRFAPLQFTNNLNYKVAISNIEIYKKGEQKAIWSYKSTLQNGSSITTPPLRIADNYEVEFTTVNDKTYKYKKYNQVLSLQWDISNIDCNKIYAKEDFAEK